MVLAQSLHEKVPPYLIGTEGLAHYTLFFILKTVSSAEMHSAYLPFHIKSL